MRLHLMALDYLVAALSHVRAIAGREAITVELNLWVRELTRIDRDGLPRHRLPLERRRRTAWAATVDHAYAPDFPALYCRHCGRSGWGVTWRRSATTFRRRRHAIRQRHATKEGRFRPLLAAPAEADFSIGLGRSGGPSASRTSSGSTPTIGPCCRRRPNRTTNGCGPAGCSPSSPTSASRPTTSRATTRARPASRRTAYGSSAAPSRRCCQ